MLAVSTKNRFDNLPLKVFFYKKNTSPVKLQAKTNSKVGNICSMYLLVKSCEK